MCVCFRVRLSVCLSLVCRSPSLPLVCVVCLSLSLSLSRSLFSLPFCAFVQHNSPPPPLAKDERAAAAAKSVWPMPKKLRKQLNLCVANRPL